MRKFFLLSAILLFPALALAHGGVSKNVGSVVVYLNQSPISPLVGENVDMNFVIRDGQNQAVANLPVTLKLIDTAYNDPSKDKEILNQTFTTDANGSFDFTRGFSKENYFDVELNFLDPVNHTPQTTGFLVQPRAALGYYWLLPTAFIALFLGWLISRRAIKRGNNNQSVTI